MKKNDERYVKRLYEKIYSGRLNDSSNFIDSELRMFFDELVSRKRNDPIEGGLQASVIILSDGFAAKVTENNGFSLHSCASVNLVKYLRDNDSKYFSEKVMRFPMIYYEQTMIISEEGISIRILDGEDTLMLAVESFQRINDFQKEILKKIVDACRSVIDNYKNIEIGINIPGVVVDFTNLCEENYESIITEIVSKKSRIKR